MTSPVLNSLSAEPFIPLTPLITREVEELLLPPDPLLEPFTPYIVTLYFSSVKGAMENIIFTVLLSATL